MNELGYLVNLLATYMDDMPQLNRDAHLCGLTISIATYGFSMRLNMSLQSDISIGI